MTLTAAWLLTFLLYACRILSKLRAMTATTGSIWLMRPPVVRWRSGSDCRFSCGSSRMAVLMKRDRRVGSGAQLPSSSTNSPGISGWSSEAMRRSRPSSQPEPALASAAGTASSCATVASWALPASSPLEAAAPTAGWPPLLSTTASTWRSAMPSQTGPCAWHRSGPGKQHAATMMHAGRLAAAWIILACTLSCARAAMSDMYRVR
mmetsp:Transcript_11712/g.31346  ORF Transcript_11712/g.31346 Transcript_11712/m.31346 type:complete len:206 (-) Transcript_11712:41-658(-)